MFKQVIKLDQERQKVLAAVDKLCEPIKQTISPKGRNVIFENDIGELSVTNDGATIAKNIVLEDGIENAVVELIKSSSLKTNSEVGDGTSTSILLSSILIKEGLKLIENGMNPMDVQREFKAFGERIIRNLEKQKLTIKNDSDLLKIATISANSDEEVARNVVKAFKTSGQDGLIFGEPNNKIETEIVEETGFKVEGGLFTSELVTDVTKGSSTYGNCPVLITDKRLYYPEEAQTILETVLLAGYKTVVVVAKDFIGQFPNHMVANHVQRKCNVVLIKDKGAEKDTDSLYDLAAYLGGDVVTDKKGRIVDKLTIDDFVIADKVYASQGYSLISSKKKNNKAAKARVAGIKEELKKDKDNSRLKGRLASMTNGVVTIKIGGATQVEQIEKRYRYEDAIMAVRAAAKDGYLVGGGRALYNAFKEGEHPAEFRSTFRKFCTGNVRQIAENCGKHPETIIEDLEFTKPTWGYNALTDKVEDLLQAGVIDPFKVTEMAVRNSISVVGQIISGNYLVINDRSQFNKEEDGTE